MSVEFQSRRIQIPNGRGTRAFTESVRFSSQVRRADTAIKSYKLDFSGSDHHINVIEVSTSIENFFSNTVNFRIQCQYADKNFDDNYHGEVEILVLADVD